MFNEKASGYAEQNFSIKLYEKDGNGIKKLPHGNCTLPYIPQAGNYFIPLGSENIYKILAVIHDDMDTYLVLEVDNTNFKFVAENRYK